MSPAVVGVGAWHKGQSTVANAVTDDEWRQMHHLGVRAELGGIQLDADGAPIHTSLTERLIGITARELQVVPDVLAVVYGTANAGAVQAAVRGGFVSSLITHTAMGS